MFPDTAANVVSQSVFIYAVTAFIGLCLGSFATALAHRLPLGQSILTKTRSSCPSCGLDLQMMDLVPFFSWLFLKGRCRRCRALIGWRYPVIELSTVFLCLVTLFVFGLNWALVSVFLLMPVVVAIVDIDFRYRIIPDSLNLWIALLGIASIILFFIDSPRGYSLATDRLVAGLIAGAGYGLGAICLRLIVMKALQKDPMGFGDIKLFAAMGIWLGLSIENLAALLVISGFSSMMIGLVWKKISDDPEYPFGPAIIMAFLAILFYRGENIFLM